MIFAFTAEKTKLLGHLHSLRWHSPSSGKNSSHPNRKWFPKHESATSSHPEGDHSLVPLAEPGQQLQFPEGYRKMQSASLRGQWVETNPQIESSPPGLSPLTRGDKEEEYLGLGMGGGCRMWEGGGVWGWRRMRTCLTPPGTFCLFVPCCVSRV